MLHNPFSTLFSVHCRFRLAVRSHVKLNYCNGNSKMIIPLWRCGSQFHVRTMEKWNEQQLINNITCIVERMNVWHCCSPHALSLCFYWCMLSHTPRCATSICRYPSFKITIVFTREWQLHLKRDAVSSPLYCIILVANMRSVCTTQKRRPTTATPLTGFPRIAANSIQLWIRSHLSDCTIWGRSNDNTKKSK